MPMIDSIEEIELSMFDNSSIVQLDWESDDERLNAAVDELYDSLPFSHVKKSNIVKHLKPVLLMCIRYMDQSQTGWISYVRDNNWLSPLYTRKLKIFNPHRLKPRSLKKVIDALEDSGFVDVWTGKRDWWASVYVGRVSRFKPKEHLLRFIEDRELLDIERKPVELNEGVILKDENGEYIYDYSATEETEEQERSKATLRAYNALIADTEITLQVQDSDCSYYFDKIVTSRRFSKGSYELGGRFYGGWWTNCKKIDRRTIRINGQETIELDYKANHLCLLYGIEDQNMQESLVEDPYKISDDFDRKVVKAVFTRMINCRTFAAMWNAIINAKREEKEPLKSLLLEQLPNWERMMVLYSLILRTHPVIERHRFREDKGLKLQYLDSKIAEYVLDQSTQSGVPCLCIHDSFIVPEDKEQELRKWMTEAYDFIGLPKGLPRIEKQ